VSTAYVDTSFVLAIIFGEPRAPALRAALGRHRALFAGDLLVAEALSAAAREGIEHTSVLAAIEAVSLGPSSPSSRGTRRRGGWPTGWGSAFA